MRKSRREVTRKIGGQRLIAWISDKPGNVVQSFSSNRARRKWHFAAIQDTLKNVKASIKQQRTERGMEAKFSKLPSEDLPKGSGL